MGADAGTAVVVSLTFAFTDSAGVEQATGIRGFVTSEKLRRVVGLRMSPVVLSIHFRLTADLMSSGSTFSESEFSGEVFRRFREGLREGAEEDARAMIWISIFNLLHEEAVLPACLFFVLAKLRSLE